MSAFKIILSVNTEAVSALRNELSEVLKSAGFSVNHDVHSLESFDPLVLERQLGEADAAVFLIEPGDVQVRVNGQLELLLKHLCEAAMKELNKRPDFRVIWWLHPSYPLSAFSPMQALYVNQLRNSIGSNTVFTNSASSIELVDDLRSLIDKKEEQVFDLKETEIFLISNQLDETESEEVVDMLTDIVEVEKLSIVQDSDMDYSEYCSQQIGKSKLAVVYFKESGDWALPFAQQVWKKIGGASSHTPLLLIGDEDPETNMNKKFKAPKVISLIVSGELIPLEIKVQYDKITELLQK